MIARVSPVRPLIQNVNGNQKSSLLIYSCSQRF